METIKEIDYKELYHKEFFEKQRLAGVLRTLYTSTPDMIWIKDYEGKYIWGNAKLIHGLLLQSSLEDIINRTDLEIASGVNDETHTAGTTCTSSDVLVMQKNKQMYFIEEFHVGGVYTVLGVTKEPMRDSNGDVIGTVGIGRDITELYQGVVEGGCTLEEIRSKFEQQLYKED